MSITWMIIVLIFLFLILSQGADLLVSNVKKIADRWKIDIFIMGLILGLLTSVPEMILASNAIRQGYGELSLGNLLGGIIILLGLVLGVSIIVNRQIRTDGHIWKVLPGMMLFALPLLLGLKGTLNRWDGLVMILAYGVMVAYDYWHTRKTSLLKLRTLPKLVEATSEEEEDFIGWWRKKQRIWRPLRWLVNPQVWRALFGFILVVVSANLIMILAEKLLVVFNLSEVFLGAVVFAVGTNLPEIVVAFRSFLCKVGELSTSHIMGSAIGNILIIGVLLQFTQFQTGPTLIFGLTGLAIALLAGLFLLFYKTDRRFSRFEGFILLSIYLAYIGAQIIWGVN